MHVLDHHMLVVWIYYLCQFGWPSPRQVTEVISVECCTFKTLNLYMLIPYHCYLFDFVLFYYFQVLNKDAINSIDFGHKAHFEKT